MKKLLYLTILFTLVIIGVGVTKEVKAVSINFDFGNNSPRFQYLYDDSDQIIPLEFEFIDDFDNPELVEDIEIIIEQVTYDGEYIKILDTYNTNYQLYNSTVIIASSTFTGNVSIDFMQYLYISHLSYVNISGIAVEGVVLASTEWGFYDDTTLYINPPSSAVGDTIIVTYTKETSDTYISNLYYDWRTIQWDLNDIIFYRIMYNELILFTGAVMKSPVGNLPYDTYGLEVGEFLVEPSGVPDFTKQDDFTYDLTDDNYLILHYRIPQALITAIQYRVIRITDINSNTTEDAFITDDILSLQGGSSENFANSFIIIPIDDVIGGGLLCSYDVFNDRFDGIKHDYAVGSYLFALEDQTDSNALLYASSVIVNMTEGSDDPFEIGIFKKYVSNEETQRVLFYKNDYTIVSAYSTSLAEDELLGVDYSSNIDGVDTTYSISYYLDETAVEGLNVNVVWYVEPSFLPYSLDVTDYTIELTDSYEATGDIDIEGRINNFLVYNAFDTPLGGVIFAVLFLLFINVLLLIFAKSSIIYIVINISVILGLTMLIDIPMWIIIALGFILLIGLKMLLSGGSNYE